jgi:predicted dehydrogenase
VTQALVIGHGSIGARHARVLAGLGLEVAVVSRRTIGVSRCFRSIPDALEAGRPIYTVIASQTNEHHADITALALAGYAGTLLIEKPLFTGPVAIPAHKFAAAYVGYNLRFHPVIGRLRELLAGQLPRTVQIHVGQHLADWRPGTDYRSSYSAHRGAGGGVLRDLSHELDYLCWLFGPWRRLAATGGHVSVLEIDSEDVMSLIIETESCASVALHMNYLDRPARRDIHAVTDNKTIYADLLAGTIEYDGHVEKFDIDRDDTYIAEHRAALNGDSRVLCTLAEGHEIVHMIAAAETALAEGRWVSR